MTLHPGSEDESLSFRMLRIGREEAPSFESRQRALAALGMGGAAVTTATTAVATASAGSSTAIAVIAVKWAGIGLLVGATVTGFAKRDALFPRAPAPSSAHATTTQAARVANATQRALEPAPVAPVLAVDAPPAAKMEEMGPSVVSERRAMVAPTTLSPSNAPVVEEPEATSILREVNSLDVVKRRLDARDPNGALAALDDHEREFGRGALGPEALVLSIEAFAMKSDGVRVRALADEFFAAYPKSPHAERVRDLARRSAIP